MQWFGSKPSRTPGSVAYPRKHERFDARGLKCALGEVVDVSAGGMRVKRDSKPFLENGAIVDVGVHSDSHKLSLKAQIRWIRRLGWKHYELGLKWLAMSPKTINALLELAEYGWISGRDMGAGGGGGAAGGGGSTKREEPAPSAAQPAVGASQAKPEEPAPSLTMTIEVEDLYKVLGVARDASQDDVHAAYRALARQLHPDVNKTPEAHEQFALVSKAFAVIKDPITRRKYDIMLARSQDAA